ncbi:MAG: hypothetical protein HQK60_10350 [Deltaproteobacteria bacterium]|nr:hypothetical protein [Deltaproteobacteria bacterium]
MRLSVIKSKLTEMLKEPNVDSFDELASFGPINDEKLISSFLKIDHRANDVNKQKLIKMMTESGFLLEGHFSLLSGMHSKYFLSFNNLARSTPRLHAVSELIADIIIDERIEVDAIIAPETAGSYLASVIGGILFKKGKKEVEMVYAKTDDDKKPTSIINYLGLKAGSKVLIVNDLVTTGAGIKELYNLSTKYGVTVQGFVMFATRKRLQDIPWPPNSGQFRFALVDGSALENHTYRSSDCPICKNEQTKPVPSMYLN